MLIRGRSHRVDVDEKRLSIEWETPCPWLSYEGPVGLLLGGVGGIVPWGHNDSVDVYLTE